MNTNVSDMPLEIFGDYISDQLDTEFTWEYLIPATNGFSNQDFFYGIGIEYDCENLDTFQDVFGWFEKEYGAGYDHTGGGRLRTDALGYRGYYGLDETHHGCSFYGA